ncbi:MAG: hypothetical protein ACP5T7_09565 [bacterium]
MNEIQIKEKEHEESEKFLKDFFDAIIVALILSLIFLSLVIIFRWGI